MQKARRHGSPRSDRLRAHGFRVYFTPLPGFFSPFPHGTRSLSVSWECLALADGPACFAQGFSRPALLRVPLRMPPPAPTGLSPSVAGLSSPSGSAPASDVAALQPPRGLDRAGLGSPPSARRYSGGHFLVFLSCRY